MNLGLTGKVAVVTGASRGMGKAIAQRLASEGATVVMSSSTPEQLQMAASEVEEVTGKPVRPIVCDLRDAVAIETMFAKVQELYGGLDILVSNAGGPPRSAFVETSDDEWQYWFNLTFLGFVRLSRSAIPAMQARGGGHILTIGSNSTIHPIEKFVLSNALRQAVLGLVTSLAGELGNDGIRVTTLSPGRIATDRFLNNSAKKARLKGIDVQDAVDMAIGDIPLGRLGSPEEIADLVAFVVSDRGRYITGNNILLDGGLTIAPRSS